MSSLSKVIFKEDSIVLEYAPPRIDRVIRSGPATIVFWEDGTKTVVKLRGGEAYDSHEALLACVAKKVYGSSTKVNKALGEWDE